MTLKCQESRCSKLVRCQACAETIDAIRQVRIHNEMRASFLKIGGKEAAYQLGPHGHWAQDRTLADYFDEALTLFWDCRGNLLEAFDRTDNVDVWRRLTGMHWPAPYWPDRPGDDVARNREWDRRIADALATAKRIEEAEQRRLARNALEESGH